MCNSCELVYPLLSWIYNSLWIAATHWFLTSYVTEQLLCFSSLSHGGKGAQPHHGLKFPTAVSISRDVLLHTCKLPYMPDTAGKKFKPYAERALHFVQLLQGNKLIFSGSLNTHSKCTTCVIFNKAAVALDITASCTATRLVRIITATFLSKCHGKFLCCICTTAGERFNPGSVVSPRHRRVPLLR